MIIPAMNEPWAAVEPDLAWAALSADAKRERILCAAGYLFSTEGLETPMPAIAARAGAGIGSLYRQFPSKRDLLAALVIRRLEQIHDAAVAAAEQEGSRWHAFTDMLWAVVERQHADDFLGEAWKQVGDDEDVAPSSARAITALEALLDVARDEGGLRGDATTVDIRLVFAATRVAKLVEPDAWQRMLTLLIDGLAARH